MAEPTHRSLDALGPPVSETTFCVIDVETTGGSARTGAITEIGAVRLRAGRQQATFSTLVDPGRPIPGHITRLTGIDAALVADAPPFSTVADELAEFVADTVVVGHNIRYDLSYLAAELERCGRPRFTNPSVCTLALARRLVRDEVRDCKLGTLARTFRLGHQPNHRALDDALATADLLRILLERAGRMGILGLQDLLVLPRLAGHPQAEKLALTDGLPRAPGVYLFRDRSGNVLYVGRATDLRARVRSYFSSDDRRKVGALLRSVASIDHEVCVHPLAAAVREVELIARYLPRFNSRATRWRSMAYVRLTDEPFPRLSVVRTPPPPGSVYLGPVSSAGAAHRVVDAITSVVPLRRCTARVPTARHREASGQLCLDGLGDPVRPARCAPAQLGVAHCPCAGDISAADYAVLCERIRRAFEGEAVLLLEPLRERLLDLARQERFEQAAAVRDRAATLAAALRRRRRLESWRTPRRIVLVDANGAGAELIHGRLHRAWSAGDRPAWSNREEQTPEPPAGPVPREQVYERLCVITELERARSVWRIEHVDGVLVEPADPIDPFTVRGTSGDR